MKSVLNFAFSFLMLLCVVSAHSATITVTSLSRSSNAYTPGIMGCPLREAMAVLKYTTTRFEKGTLGICGPNSKTCWESGCYPNGAYGVNDTIIFAESTAGGVISFDTEDRVNRTFTFDFPVAIKGPASAVLDPSRRVNFDAKGLAGIFFVDGKVTSFSVNDINFIGGKAYASHGGAISYVDNYAYNPAYGNLAIERCDFISNTGSNWGGAVASGGAAKTVLVRDSLFDGNSPDAMTNTGGALTSSNSDTPVGVSIQAGTTVSVERTIFRNTEGTALFVRGDNSKTLISNSLFENNKGTNSPAYRSQDFNVYARISDSVFANNSAISPGDQGFGGAVYISLGYADIERSTFKDNIASGIYGEKGGAIYMLTNTDSASVKNANVLNIVDSVFYDNISTKPGGGRGDAGAIFLRNNGSKTKAYTNISHTTFSGNSSATYGGAIASYNTNITGAHLSFVNNSSSSGSAIYASYSNVAFKNTLLASVSNSPHCVTYMSGSTLTSSFIGDTNMGWRNNVEDTSCGGQIPNSNNPAPYLGSLADNGGPTFTHALLLGSPAINRGNFIYTQTLDLTGNPANWGPATTDQRGFIRPVSDTPDIGAYESAALMP